jgi:hypothetical protein
MAKSNRHTGSMFDEFLKEDGKRLAKSSCSAGFG